MSKLEQIQSELSAKRLERARLRRSLQVIEDGIARLEVEQDVMEQAIAIVGADDRAGRLGLDAVRRIADKA